MTGLARLCSTCVNGELALLVFPDVSLNITGSAGEVELFGDDGELHLLSLMLPLILSKLHIISSTTGFTTLSHNCFTIGTLQMSRSPYYCCKG